MQVLWTDGERAFYRGKRPGKVDSLLIATPAIEQPLPASLERLAHEFSLKDELDGAWAVQPLELVREGGRTLLVLADPGGEPLERLLTAPLSTERFLHLAVGMAAALGKLHQRGLVHKDLKPTHILVNCDDGQVRLTGFGLASWLPRERQVPMPPETIAGTLAYMAPEQTGWMNRSIDSRCDLYALGITYYQMLTGSLPFNAVEPMEWVHCHIARKPPPPNTLVDAIPETVSNIVMKLLAKTAEERYYTAAGVENDLRRCLQDWQSGRRIEPFLLDEQGMPDRLLIPEKLYGRESEVQTLLDAFGRVVESGLPQLVLVTGYSGVGKSSVVNELHKALVPMRGLFASGKFDQYKRDIPYSTLVQAFQSLVRTLLGKSDEQLASWREALLEALEPNARLMSDLIPELKLIIGEPAPVPMLEPQQAQGRFLLVFRRFIEVFARPEHPLALFLDDLQWLDNATLDLLEGLLSGSGLSHLMLIGAYRSNEIKTPRLAEKLLAIKQAGIRVEEIRLGALCREHVEQMIAQALHCEQAQVGALAQLVHNKTAGNAFFVNQFLQSLVEEKLLTFDQVERRWCWDPRLIHAKGYADNVVDLMVDKMSRLPSETRHALQQLACLGDNADITALATVLGKPQAQVHGLLWPAVRQELVDRLDGIYTFVHDRVREAAYSLIPDALRAESHLRIGRLLASQIPLQRQEDAIFEIVGQLNRGVALMTGQREREQLAAFNLLAGQRAKASTAYVSALASFTLGASLLNEGGWNHRHELLFALELGRAECELLSGQLVVAEDRLGVLSGRATSMNERVQVAILQVDVYLMLHQGARAVEVCLAFLSSVGIECSAHPDDVQVSDEYERLWSLLGSRTIEQMVDLPPMEEPVALATIQVLTVLFSPAFHSDLNLASVAVCKAINLSLEYGNSDASCAAYASIPRLAGWRFGDLQTGYRFGRLGLALVKGRDVKRYEARAHVCFATFVERWIKPLRDCAEPLRQAFVTANQVGDLTYGAFTRNCLVTNSLFMGEHLRAVQAEAEQGLAYVRKVQFGMIIDIVENQLMLIRMLRGMTTVFGCFDDAAVSEFQIEQRLAKSSKVFACWYWIRKLQARFLACDYPSALEAGAQAKKLLWASTAFLEIAEYHFYNALATAAVCDTAAIDQRSRHLEAVVMHQRQLQRWADACPDNFASRAVLVSAEIARLENRVDDSERLYDEAIRLAQDSGFVHIEALANELASRYYAMRGLAKIARLYLQDARYAYMSWGADGKVRQLEASHRFPAIEALRTDPTSTMATAVEHLDLATVLKVSQAASGEIVLEKLIDMVMRTAIEQAGAERCLLILSEDGKARIAALATTDGDETLLHDVPVSEKLLVVPILYQVLRTRESVVIEDAMTQPSLACDPYVRGHQARSILCLPLMNRAQLTGALYLENNLAAGVFNPARIAVLKLVASQAAIALVNARLYRDIAEREAKIRRLVDANIIGVLVWTTGGHIVEANGAFLRMVGYEREDLVLGRLRWRDLTPAKFRQLSERSMQEAVTSGQSSSFEKEYVRKDGTHVPVIVGLAMLESNREEGIAFVLDLTERKQAEAQNRESEQRYREIQTELAHACRVATMGQLAASIAHEVSQPITSALASASAAQRWVGAQPPDLDEVRQNLDRIVKDTNRAGEVLGRIRGLIRKAPQQKGHVHVNEIICEVIEITRGQATKSGVTVEWLLSSGLPPVSGDRVELQQVLLNLIMNALEAMTGAGSVDGRLCIRSTTDETGNVWVSVSDSGPGFASQSTAQLFTPFYTTKATGLGMGLSICRSIIETHGGQLWTADNLPRGATVQFTLPACALTAD